MSVTARGKGWKVDIKVGNRRVRRNFNCTKEEALQKEAEIRIQMQQGTYSEKAVGVLTLREAFDDTLAEHWRQDKSYNSHASNASIICDILGGDLGIDKVDAGAVRRLKKHMLNEGRKPATVNRKLSTLQKMMNVAVDEWGLPLKLPKFTKLREPSGRIRFMSQAEENEMYDALRLLNPFDLQKQLDFWAVSFDTGLRTSELRTVNPRNISLDLRTITVADTKNGTTRTIPMTSRVQGIMTRRLAEHGDNPWDSLEKGRVAKVWKKVKALTSMADDDEVVPHIMRHTFASRLVQRGVPLYEVMKLLGHKNITITQRYAHLAPNSLTDAIRYLEPEQVAKAAVPQTVPQVIQLDTKRGAVKS